MTRLVLAVIAIASLTGCHSMTNEEIAKESKFCTDNGLRPVATYSAIDYSIYKIQCWPKEEGKP